MNLETQEPIPISRTYSSRFPLGPAFLVTLGVSLSGYAFLGRGFAHLGVPPVFVGEVVLLLGLLSWALTGSTRIFKSKVSWLLVLLMAIGALGTVNWVGTYGMNALRDGALWGYGLFALLVGTFLLRGNNRILTVIQVYAKWIPWLLILAPIAMTVYIYWGHLIPKWPASSVPILNPKGGHLAVHMSGALAFISLGLYRLYGTKNKKNAIRVEWLLWSLLIIGSATILTGRAALLTMASTALILLIIRPSKHWVKPIIIGVLSIVMALALDLKVEDKNSNRTASPQSLVQAFESIFQETGVDSYDGTRRWRMEWWTDIWNYTVRGEYFWSGKGYGVNLADVDGYQTYYHGIDQPHLRSPHNSHLTFLARSGVPGFVVWIALNGMFAISLFRAYQRARRQGREVLAKLNLWVLAYWWAFMVNAGFDVFLEGPHGGIWFWSLFGFGIALLGAQKQLFVDLQPTPGGGSQSDPA